MGAEGTGSEPTSTGVFVFRTCVPRTIRAPNSPPTRRPAGTGRLLPGGISRMTPTSAIPHPTAEITRYLHAIGRGEAWASEELLPLVYEELRRHAAVRMSRERAYHTLQPTALVHEAWMRMTGKENRHWENRAHFFGAAAEAMRRILIENARRKARLKRGGDWLRVDLEKIELAETTPEEKILLINEALERLQLESPQKAQVVVLKFFGGYTNEEAARALGVAERTIERHWAYAKAWLFESIRSRN